MPDQQPRTLVVGDSDAPAPAFDDAQPLRRIELLDTTRSQAIRPAWTVRIVGVRARRRDGALRLAVRRRLRGRRDASFAIHVPRWTHARGIAPDESVVVRYVDRVARAK